MSTRRKSAFTLIELLVVIAIIAILVSILMPSLAKAKYSAKLAACMSNLHNIGEGVMVYSGEYNGAWPARPSQSEAGSLVEMIKTKSAAGTALDDRPLFKGIMSINLMTCPLAQPQSFDLASSNSDFLYSSYELYFGHEFTFNDPTTGLVGANARTYKYTDAVGIHTFRVMAADWDRMTGSDPGATGPRITSHPDRPGTLIVNEWNQDYGGYGTYSWSGLASNGGRNLLDRNFLYSDCSLRAIRNLKAKDSRVCMVPDSYAWSCFLPEN